MSRKGTYGGGGAGSPDRGGSSDSSSSSSSKKSSRPGMPDQPGEAEQKMRDAGVSEIDIKKSKRGRRRTPSVKPEISTSKPGQPDKPGDATAKMIKAGVLHSDGTPKEIVGYYKDPNTGKAKFVAKDEPLSSYRSPEKFSQNIDTKFMTKKDDKFKIYGESNIRPNLHQEYTSGTAYQSSVFDASPTKQSTGWFNKWYETQKTLVGLGGQHEAKEYSELVNKYELSKFTGDHFDTSKLDTKYKEYEKARGVSPLAKKDIKVKDTWAFAAHKSAEKIRADKPTYGGWQGELSRTINEAVASNVEFIGSTPTVLRYGSPIIAKHPSLALSLGVVAGGEMGKAIVTDPIQTGATMAMTGAIIKGGVKGSKYSMEQMPHLIKTKGVVGVISPKYQYRAYYDLKAMEYMFESPLHIKGGSFKTPKGLSPEAIKIQSVMPKIKSKQLIVRQPKTIIDVAKAQSHSNPYISGIAKDIMIKKGAEIKAKQLPQPNISEIKYRQARRGISEDIIAEAKQSMRTKDVMQILSRGDKYHSGLSIPDFKMGKMGTRYDIKRPFKEPEMSTYKIPDVYKSSKISRQKSPQRSHSMKKQRQISKETNKYIGVNKYYGLSSLASPDNKFIPKYDFRANIKKSKSTKKEKSDKTIPIFHTDTMILPDVSPFVQPQPISLPKTFSKTYPKDSTYNPTTSKVISKKKIPPEKNIKIPIFDVDKPKKSKKRNVKKSKAIKHDIKNPIATVEQFMMKVIK